MSILVDHNYRRCEVKIPGDRTKRITEADLAASAIPAIIAETAASVREKFMEEARHTKCKELYLHNRVRRNMVEAVFENAVNHASHAGDDIDMSAAADYLENYGSGGVWEETLFGRQTREIRLRNFKIFVGEDSVGIAFTYKGFRHLELEKVNKAVLDAIILVDAAHGMIDLALDPILLELDSFYLSQEIFFSTLPYLIDPFVAEYQGIVKVNAKCDRCTVNFYLSDTVKAFITFFRDRMPWDIPAPPTDPESLRAECVKKESPFTIVGLSKSDRRFLKNYQSTNP